MLEQDKTDDMALMYILVVKSTLVLERMNEIFEEHVTKVGFNKIQNCADEAVKVSIHKISFLQHIFAIN